MPSLFTMALSRVLHLGVLACLALCLCLCGAGCQREPERTTPEGTIAAARMAVERADARRVADFIYAENEDYRKLLRRFGRFMNNLQELGVQIQKKFPQEIAAMQAKAEEAAKSGRANTLMAQIGAQMRPQGMRRRGGPPPQDTRTAFEDALKALFADPYKWLRESEGRLTTTYLTDDSVALLWDEQPILPPIGMVMRRAEDGFWYFMLPTNLPGVSNFMPRTKEQFEIFGGLITVFDRVVIDLTDDIKNNRVRSLDDMSRKAGEKLFIPAAMTFYAYTRMQDSQRREARAAEQAARQAGSQPQSAGPN
ncbi:MAG: hypothetical protein KF859_02100 [Phycisphaeraceae bacterium]|nr:hypothetical protein [Phycisphaeraceae bacterium]